VSAEIAQWQIDQARESFDESLPSTALVKHRTGTGDGRGGQTESYDAGTALDCRLLPMGQREAAGREEATGHKASSWWTILFSAGSDVRTTDRVVVDGQTYEVIDHGDARSQSLVMKTSARRVK
jgi:hypothetical protein